MKIVELQKTPFIKIKKENYTYQIFTPWIIDSQNSSSSVVCLGAILSLLLWMKTNWIIDNWCSVKPWEEQNDTERKVFCEHWGHRVRDCGDSGKVTSHLGGVSVSIGATNRSWLDGWAEPAFPVSTGFKPVLVSRAAFPRFHTETESETS